MIYGHIDALGVRRLLGLGSGLAIFACPAVSLAPTLAVFLAAHVVVGLAFACLLSAGFASVAAFTPERRPWAIGYVAGANSLAWIVVTPIVRWLGAEVIAYGAWTALLTFVGASSSSVSGRPKSPPTGCSPPAPPRTLPRLVAAGRSWP